MEKKERLSVGQESFGIMTELGVNVASISLYQVIKLVKFQNSLINALNKLIFAQA